MFWSEYAQKFTERMMNARGAEAMLILDDKDGKYVADRWTSMSSSTVPPPSGAEPRKCNATLWASVFSGSRRSPIPASLVRSRT
jgi:hypothetical protein